MLGDQVFEESAQAIGFRVRRGMLHAQTANEEFARLDGAAIAFETQADERGKRTSTGWLWT